MTRLRTRGLHRSSSWLPRVAAALVLAGSASAGVRPPLLPPGSERFGLESNADHWGVWLEPPGRDSPSWSLYNVAAPGRDGLALGCSIDGGTPHTNLHVYRHFLSEPEATRFALSLSFRFSPGTSFNNQGEPSVVQALEFTMNKWLAGTRYEWALQWVNVGATPQWRYWVPSCPGTGEWLSMDPVVPAELAGETWHALALLGDIVAGQVHYRGFSIDGSYHNLDVTVPARDCDQGEPDRLAIGVQLDGNSTETPWRVVLDDVRFVRGSATCAPLAAGYSLQDCETTAGWRLEWDDCGMMPPSMSLVPGYRGQAIRMDYDFEVPGSVPPRYCAWAQLRLDFPGPPPFGSYDMLRLHYRGGGAKNHLQVWLHDEADVRVGLQVDRVTDVGAWVYYTLPYSVPARGIFGSVLIQTNPPTGERQGEGSAFDINKVRKLFFAVSRDTARDRTVGKTVIPAPETRSGSLAIDAIELVDSRGRLDPVRLSPVPGDPVHAEAAAGWVVSRQCPSGLVHSWLEEDTPAGLVPQSHVYDQALALILYTRKGLTTARASGPADILARKLVALQNPDGSWYKWYRCDTSEPDDRRTLWEGDVAWAAYALLLYWHRTDYEPARAAAVRACTWLAGRIDARGDGSVHNGIEANIDAWFAFDLVGGFVSYADQVKRYLLEQGWDAPRRRFCRGPLHVDPGNALDVSTWGSEFLARVKEPARARATLGFACGTLAISSFDGAVEGLDGQGPFSVWFEGMGQYVAAGGEHADLMLAEMNANQEADGSSTGSSDDFAGEGVWLTTWHGVAPTAWNFFANSSPVFGQGLICGKAARPYGVPAELMGTVLALRPETGEVVSEAAVHGDGTYCLTGLSGGDHRVRTRWGCLEWTHPDLVAVTLSATSTLDLTSQSDPVWHRWFAVDTRETPYVGDFNGDGQDDIITFTRDNPLAFGDVYVALSEGDRFGDNRKWHDWFAIARDEVVVIGDYDGDGKADIGTWLQGRTWQVYVARSLGNAMEPAAVWLDRIGSDAGDVLAAGDANGDGKDDLILFARSRGLVQVALATGSGFAPPTVWHRWFAVSTWERPAVGDLNGDGRTDILTFGTDSPTARGDVYVALSTGSQFEDGVSSRKWHDWFSVDPAQIVRIGDLDGDGLADLFTFMPRPSDQVYTAQSHGSYLGPNVLVEVPGLTRRATDVPWVADADGNGPADIVVFHREEHVVRVHRALCTVRPPDEGLEPAPFEPGLLVRPGPGQDPRAGAGGGCAGRTRLAATLPWELPDVHASFERAEGSRGRCGRR